jgi:transcriptional regulator with XRE-family HTH domain
MDVQAKELAEIFRTNMRARRQALGMTQVRLAKVMGLPQSYISELETGDTVPNLLSLAALAEALDTTPSMLISGAAVLV